MEDVPESLDPDAIRAELVKAGLLCVAFDILRDQLEQKLRGFFADSFRGWDPLPSDEYRGEVLTRHKSSFMASALWYVDQGVLVADDIPTIERIRSHRNDVAHSLPNYLFDPANRIKVEILEAAKRYIDIVSKYWVRTWATCDPTFDGVDLETVDIQPASSIVMKYLLDSVHDLGAEQKSG